jgi:hypothetical protein
MTDEGRNAKTRRTQRIAKEIPPAGIEFER